jgi:hypothetical protein
VESDRVLLFLGIVAVLVSLTAAGITSLSVGSLFNKITGYETSGEANLTIESLAIINFTTRNISWGSGRVDNDANAASLTTFSVLPNVTGGNWTLTQPGGLRIENIGNVNVSLNLTGTKTAATFMGGTNAVYEWNVSSSEAGSCTNRTGKADGAELNLNVFHNVNTSVADSQKCFAFRFEAANDEVRIDFNLTIPEDSSTGVLGDTITATVTTQNPE